MTAKSHILPFLLLAVFSSSLPGAATRELGLFDRSGDIGAPAKNGSVQYDAARGAYRVTGGGENMWFGTDAFYFVWTKMSGDAALAADIRWVGTGGNAHRKACLLVRQSLEPDATYADAVFHGDGLCSLQYRESKGAPTREIQSNVSGPRRLRIEKQGDFVSMSIAPAGEELEAAGGSFQLKFQEPFYVGLGVCSHDDAVVETAVFSNVKLSKLPSQPTRKPVLESTLETVAIGSQDRRVVYHARGHFEAPNWSRDGKYFLFNREGHIYRLPITGGEPIRLDTGFADHCNNDHGISPDGTQLAISHQPNNGRSLIYVLPIEGGTPRQVTPAGPSYWHGWSPDGKTLAYCAERNGEFDVYSIPAAGGSETRLTTATGLDDGPDYSPDGHYIYFNSERTGTMQIWRMHPDGSHQEQLTTDELNDWFPHPSPDGRWIAFLSYGKEVKGHPANQNVQLRLMPTGGGPLRVLAKLFGGQGTMNVPSWSPDSRSLAFVSYRLVNDGD